MKHDKAKAKQDSVLSRYAMAWLDMVEQCLDLLNKTTYDGWAGRQKGMIKFESEST